MFSKSASDKLLKPTENGSLSRMPCTSKVMVGVPPVNDENAQNFRIQMAVNRYNSNVLSPYQQVPLSAYRCSALNFKPTRLHDITTHESPGRAEGVNHCRQFLFARPRNRHMKDESLQRKMPEQGLVSGYEYPSNSFYLRQRLPKIIASSNETIPAETKHITPEMRYPSPGQLPTCFLMQPSLRRPPKYNIMSHIKAHSSGLPVSRVLDDSAEKYSDLKSTRSVLDVLQDLSRKRIHDKDEPEENNKRRCKGLGGDIVQEGDVAYQPLFVPKSRSPLHSKKDQTTQTIDGVSSSASGSPTSLDPKAELRRKLALQNNEIFASLSSSLQQVLFHKRKRAAEVNKTNCEIDAGESKRKKTSGDDSSENELRKVPTLHSITPEIRRKSLEKSPRSPPTKDRLMSIYHDLKDSKQVKLNALKSIQASPGENQFVRPPSSPITEDSVPKDEIDDLSTTLKVPKVSAATIQVQSECKIVPESNNKPIIIPLTKEVEAPSTKLYGMPAILTTASSVALNTKFSSPSSSVSGMTFSFSPSATLTSVTTSSASPIPSAYDSKTKLNFVSSPNKSDVSTSSVLTETPTSPPTFGFIAPSPTSITNSSVVSPKALPFTFGLKKTEEANYGKKLSFGATTVEETPPPPFNSTLSASSIDQKVSENPLQFGSVLSEKNDFKLNPVALKSPTPSGIMDTPKFSFGAVTPTDKVVSSTVANDPKPSQHVTLSSQHPTLLPAAREEKTSVFTRLGSFINEPTAFDKTLPQSNSSSLGNTSETPKTLPQSDIATSLVIQPTSSFFTQSLNTTTKPVATTTVTVSTIAPSTIFSFGGQTKDITSTNNVFGAISASIPGSSSNITNNPVVATTATASSAFSFGTKTTSSPFAFGSNSNTDIKSVVSSVSPFAFAPNTALPTTSPSLTFGSTTTTVSAPSVTSSTTFSFGTNNKSTLSPSPFKFDTSTIVTTASVTSTTPFTFGAKATASTNPVVTTASIPQQIKSAISFGEPPATSNVLFGPTTTSSSAGGIFSFVPVVSTTSSNSTFTFGTATSAPQTAPNPAFGVAPIAPTTSFSFGSTSESPTTTSSAFGQTLNPATIFGSITTPTPLFGPTAATTTSSGLFGKVTAVTTPSTFGTVTTTTSSFLQPISTASLSQTTSPPVTTNFGTSSSVFGFNQAAGSSPFTFGNNNSSFGAVVTTSPPAFGQSNGTFTFGGGSESAFGQPSANFGAQPSAVITTTTSSVFPSNTFGNTLGNQPATGAFGQPSQTAPSFGQTTHFQFGTTTTGNATNSFSFGPKVTSPRTQAQPFTFGAANPATVSFSANPSNVSGFGTTNSGATIPAFGTTSNSATPAAGFNNGSSFLSGSPAFGTPAPTPTTTASAPFTFGATPVAKPSFNFGSAAQSSQTSAAPFTFGGGSSTSGGSSGFNFSAGPAPSSGFNFSAATGFAQSPTSTSINFGTGATSTPNAAFSATPATSPFTFGATPAAAFSIPGTFSIGSGSSQPRPRSTARARRRQ